MEEDSLQFAVRRITGVGGTLVGLGKILVLLGVL